MRKENWLRREIRNYICRQWCEGVNIGLFQTTEDDFCGRGKKIPLMTRLNEGIDFPWFVSHNEYKEEIIHIERELKDIKQELTALKEYLGIEYNTNSRMEQKEKK